MNISITDAQKRKCLERVRASSVLQRSGQLQNLLQWLGDVALKGGPPPSEYDVGAKALGRGVDYDPQTDSLARREMFRLREKLRSYYSSSEGIGEPIQIVCSRGYQLHFVLQSQMRVIGKTPLPCLLILPLRADPELERWAHWLFEELFNHLIGAVDFDLVSQTTALTYAGRLGDIRDFAAETGASRALEGTVRIKDGYRVTTLWLVDGTSGRVRDRCVLSGVDVAELGRQVADWLSQELGAGGTQARRFANG